MTYFSTFKTTIPRIQKHHYNNSDYVYLYRLSNASDNDKCDLTPSGA
jgi:hypothetical protein